MKLRRLVLEAVAEAEIADATAWYEQQSAQLAFGLIGEVRSALERAARQPSGSLVVPGVAPELGARRLLLSTFPTEGAGLLDATYPPGPHRALS